MVLMLRSFCFWTGDGDRHGDGGTPCTAQGDQSVRSRVPWTSARTHWGKVSTSGREGSAASTAGESRLPSSVLGAFPLALTLSSLTVKIIWMRKHTHALYMSTTQ